MKNLRDEREELGATLGVVAALARVHESRLSKGERGILMLTEQEERRVTDVLKRLRKIVDACIYPPDLRDPRRLSRMIESLFARTL